MGLKKLPNEQSLEELLNSLNSEEEVNVVSASDDVFSFVSHFNIQPGEELVLKVALYDLYKKWSTQPVNRETFSVRTNKLFIEHVKGQKKYYKINLSSILIQQETLKYLEKKKLDRTKYPGWQKHFNDFIKFYNITKGNVWIPSYVLMHFYDKWCYNNRRKPLLSEITFFNFCKLHFEYKRNNESRMMWFGLNEEFFKSNLSQRKLKQFQQMRERKYGKNQKIKRKISSIKTTIKSKNKV